MMTWLIARVGAKWAPRLLWFVGIVLFLGAVFLLGRCTAGDDDREAQVEQTSRSTEAITDAAADAIQTIGNRVATEATIDQATQQVVKDIDDAQTVDAIRRTVLERVCGQAAHRLDPACRVREADTR